MSTYETKKVQNIKYFRNLIILYLCKYSPDSICLIIELFLHDFWHLEWQLEPLLSNLFWNFPGISHFPSCSNATTIIPAILLAISQSMGTQQVHTICKDKICSSNLLNRLKYCLDRLSLWTTDLRLPSSYAKIFVFL